MISRSLLVVCSLSVVLFASAEASAQPKNCNEEVGRLFEEYYENPQPLRIGEIVSFLQCSGGAPRPAAKIPLIAMFGAVLRKSPEAIPILIESPKLNGAPWNEVVMNALWFCGTKECRDALDTNPYRVPPDQLTELKSVSPIDVHKMELDSPATVDLLWGYFAATGDVTIVKRLLDLVETNWSVLVSREKPTRESRFIVAAARWTLASQAALHQRVYDYVRSQDRENPAIVAILRQADALKRQNETDDVYSSVGPGKGRPSAQGPSQTDPVPQ